MRPELYFFLAAATFIAPNLDPGGRLIGAALCLVIGIIYGVGSRL